MRKVLRELHLLSIANPFASSRSTPAPRSSLLVPGC
jgi:hypothetical protein